MKELALNLFRLINRPPARLPQITKYSISVLICSLLISSAGSAASKNTYPKIGKFFSTFYYVVNESSYPAGNDSEVRNKGGQVIAKVSRQFRKDMDMEGTGILRDGRTLNFAARNGNEILYRVSPLRWGWGVGQCALHPYKTIAVDPAQIPLGTVVYIPQLEGMKLPDGSLHDGIFLAEDIGGAIVNKHVDFFAQDGILSTLPFQDAGVRSGSYVEIFKVRDADPQGCHTLEPDEGTTKSVLGARMEALQELADQYLEQGDRERARSAMIRMYELRDEWEKAGKPEGHPRLMNTFTSAERIQILEDVLTTKYKGEVNGETLPAKQVILTFDDGPSDEYTPQIRDLLAQYSMHAAFFQVGEMVTAHPEMTQMVARAGHVLANHSFTHPQLTKLADDKVAAQIADTQAAIQAAMGGPEGFNDYFQLFFARFFNKPMKVTKPQFFRSPYGSRSERTMKIINDTKMLHVMWNVDSLDWKDHSPAGIEARVFKQLALEGDKGIILFHDIHPQTVQAIKLILPRLKREGFLPVSLYEIH